MKARTFDSSSVNRSGAISFLNRHRELFTPMSPINTGMKPRVSADRAVKAVLFDIYGTVLISQAGDIGLTALDESSGSLSFTLRSDSQSITLPVDDIRQQLTGLIKSHHDATRESRPEVTYPEVDIISVWSELYNNNGLISASSESLTETALLFEITSNRVDIMPGSIEIFRHLKSCGIPVGIVSNAQFYTPLLLEFLFGKPLSSLGFSKELESWSFREGCGKPDPLIFKTPLENLNNMGIKNEEILYVGNDMLNDVSCASGFGLKTALFAGDKRSLRLREGDDRVTVEADYVITDLLQLKQVIQGRN